MGILCLAGCAAPPQSERLLRAPPAGLAAPVELTHVPFYPQEEHQCGPAALATVLDWTGAAVTPDELTPQVYVPGREGSLQLEIEAAARRHGRLAYRIRPSLEGLFEQLRAGHPVLVLQNLAFSWYPRWHYAVVIGYDLQADRIVLRSGRQARHTTSLEVFERTWARSHYWGIVVLRPGELPAAAEELPYLDAVLGLEQVGRYAEARACYEAALRRWPGSAAAGVGVGNTHYAQGQLPAAEAAYRHVLKGHTDYAPALNNLAQTLADQHRLKEAEHYARRAVAAGGSQATVYRRTLRDILRQSNRE